MDEFIKILGGGTFGALMVAIFLALLLHFFKNRITKEFNKDFDDYRTENDKRISAFDQELKSIKDKKHFHYTYLEKQKFKFMEELHFTASEVTLECSALATAFSQGKTTKPDKYYNLQLGFNSLITRSSLYISDVDMDILEKIFSESHDLISLIFNNISHLPEKVQKLYMEDHSKYILLQIKQVDEYDENVEKLLKGLKTSFIESLNK
jgi:hypothetical protein